MNFSIIQGWLLEGIPLNGPASDKDILSCEATLDFTFPVDFKHFYNMCNGFAVWQMDSKMLSLWSLKMIAGENATNDFIAFADYNANGSQVGFVRGRQGIYHDYDRIKFCETFTEFIDHWQRETGIYI